jgi:hypothetical protein
MLGSKRFFSVRCDAFFRQILPIQLSASWNNAASPFRLIPHIFTLGIANAPNINPPRLPTFVPTAEYQSTKSLGIPGANTALQATVP